MALTAGSLAMDIQAWLHGAPNGGWMVLGDETIVGDNESSLRGFASREHENPELRPQLLFEYLLPGDFNDDGTLDETDISLLTEATLVGFDPLFDLDHDQQLNRQDRRIWVEELKRTYFGDASLDGEFNSSDMTQVFQIGEYEDAQVANSTWSEGDWNGDLEFESGDMVIAFQRGGYERGPRAGVAVVPEPAAGLLAVWALLAATLLRRRAAGRPTSRDAVRSLRAAPPHRARLQAAPSDTSLGGERSAACVAERAGRAPYIGSWPIDPRISSNCQPDSGPLESTLWRT